MNKLENTGAFATEDCAQLQMLLEFEFAEDRSLDEKENAFLTKHLDECGECRLMVDALNEFELIPEVPSKLSLSIVDEYFLRRKKRLKKSILVPTAIAAAAALFLFIFSPTISNNKIVNTETLTFTVASGSLFNESDEISRDEKVEQGQMVRAATSTILSETESLVSIGLSQGTVGSFNSTHRSDIRLHLLNGTVTAEIQPGKNVGFTVNTNVAEVTVTGTVFSVTATSDDIQIKVARGSVEVKSTTAKPRMPIKVEAGRQFSYRRNVFTKLDDASLHSMMLQIGSESMLDAETIQTPTPNERIAPSPSVEPVLPKETPSKDVALYPKNRPSHRKAATETASLATETNIPESIPHASANDLIRAARECRKQRNWNCAASSYGEVIRKFPMQPEATTVLVPLAEIELDHLRRPGVALSYYQSYNRNRPNGPLAQEALYGVCKSLRALGHIARETKALNAFLTKYPSSIYSPNAKSRMDTIHSINSEK
jgi:FecR-like protein